MYRKGACGSFVRSEWQTFNTLRFVKAPTACTLRAQRRPETDNRSNWQQRASPRKPGHLISSSSSDLSEGAAPLRRRGVKHAPDRRSEPRLESCNSTSEAPCLRKARCKPSSVKCGLHATNRCSAPVGTLARAASRSASLACSETVSPFSCPPSAVSVLRSRKCARSSFAANGQSARSMEAHSAVAPSNASDNHNLDVMDRACKAPCVAQDARVENSPRSKKTASRNLQASAAPRLDASEDVLQSASIHLPDTCDSSCLSSTANSSLCACNNAAAKRQDVSR
mmetsp:Transcript_59909/g.110993  ORF Transcript_59909/g.110993 Transcript_59909/m.110993 type:complete len:282 (-) Transcript_59909:51-896(-)